jgi:prepilin-type N-terminal cleavage/methylation domain-containing protein
MKGDTAMPHRLGNERGFTLTELLVVVGIIVLLTAIVVPNIVGRIDVARMHAAEDQIAEIETALAAYYADFGTYPGDVWPTEDKNNDGVLEPNEDANNNGSLDVGLGEDLNLNGVLDYGEDIGVDIDGDNLLDYACQANGDPYANRRLDRGDGVINILDLEWALKTTAKNGPYLNEIPLDPWDNKYVYHAPLTRPTYNSDPAANDHGNKDYLWIDPGADDTPEASPTQTLCTEDTNGTGKLDPGEDIGIADYDYDLTGTNYVRTSGGTDVFVDMRAGAGNGVLDHGDDDNKNDNIETYIDMTTPVVPVHLELGNKDVSPDGLARNLGYYIYAIGRNKKDETATGYEDINVNSLLDTALLTDDDAAFDEDAEGGDSDDSLDTGYEDTGLDGIPGTKDTGEDNWPDNENPDVGTETPTPRDEDLTGPYNTTGVLDIGGDDVNSWNKKAPWREHTNYGG